jgi:hypothetical protein
MSKNPKDSAGTRQLSPGPGRQSRPPSRGRANSGAARVSNPGTSVATEAGAGPAPQPQETIVTSFTFYSNPTLTLACVPSGAPALFSLADAAHLTGVHPEMLRYYNRAGLLDARQGALETELFFDGDALHEIRRIEHYRRHLGVGRRALPLVCELWHEGERRQIELRFLHVP